MHVVQPYPTSPNPSFSRYGREPGAVEVVGDDARARRERGLHPRLRLQAGLDGRFASSPAASITEGFDVFVHDVIAAITTEPCRHGSFRPSGRSASGSVVAAGSSGVLAAPRRPPAMNRADLAGLRVGLARSRNAATKESHTSGSAHAVLRPLRSGDRGLDRGEVQLQHLGEDRLGVAVAAEQTLLLRVALDEVDAVAPPGERAGSASVSLVDREVRGGGAVLGAHVRQRGAVGDRQRREPVAEELHERPDHAVRAQHLRERQHEVGRGRPGRQRAGDPDADHDRLRQEHRLARASRPRPRSRRRPSPARRGR